jgi:hypothetical protein
MTDQRHDTHEADQQQERSRNPEDSSSAAEYKSFDADGPDGDDTLVISAKDVFARRSLGGSMSLGFPSLGSAAAHTRGRLVLGGACGLLLLWALVATGLLLHATPTPRGAPSITRTHAPGRHASEKRSRGRQRRQRQASVPAANRVQAEGRDCVRSRRIRSASGTAIRRHSTPPRVAAVSTPAPVAEPAAPEASAPEAVDVEPVGGSDSEQVGGGPFSP